ncbi:cathelin-like [Suncus etruscus]|uniref:cathelin-like n=1 Tax=Suncus etruscus TaxID=109475 RepID=UPI0021106FEB|nr:cathelin-like [Suncus etruscus]
MENQRNNSFLGWRSLLLLLLVLSFPQASTQDLGVTEYEYPSYETLFFSYEGVALRAVEDFNQQSSESNYFRLLELNQAPNGDEDPSSPQPISFLIKETVCSKTEQQPLQQCDFKEKGSVRQCVGTVTLDSVRGSFDINCDKMQGVRLFERLKNLIRRGGQKIRGIGRRIKDFFRNL